MQQLRRPSRRRARPADGLGLRRRRVRRGVEAPRRDAEDHGAPRAADQRDLRPRAGDGRPRRGGLDRDRVDSSRPNEARELLGAAPSVRVEDFPSPGRQRASTRCSSAASARTRPRRTGSCSSSPATTSQGRSAERDPDRRAAAHAAKRWLPEKIVASVASSAPRYVLVARASAGSSDAIRRCSRDAPQRRAPESNRIRGQSDGSTKRQTTCRCRQHYRCARADYWYPSAGIWVRVDGKWGDQTSTAGFVGRFRSLNPKAYSGRADPCSSVPFQLSAFGSPSGNAPTLPSLCRRTSGVRPPHRSNGRSAQHALRERLLPLLTRNTGLFTVAGGPTFALAIAHTVIR